MQLSHGVEETKILESKKKKSEKLYKNTFSSILLDSIEKIIDEKCQKIEKRFWQIFR